MASLQSLRNRLKEYKQQHEKVDDGQDQDTTTGDVTDHSIWMGQISQLGNKAEDWLLFTNYMRNSSSHDLDEIYTSYLISLYAKAVKAINAEDHKNSTAYALLLVNFADLQSTSSVEDARGVLHHARNSVKRQAIVHIASAQLELVQDNAYKAKRLLDKARQIGAKPDYLLDKAVNNLANGQQRLISEEDKKDFTQSCISSENLATLQNAKAGGKSWVTDSAAMERAGIHKPLGDVMNVMSSEPARKPKMYTDLLRPPSIDGKAKETTVSFKTMEKPQRIRRTSEDVSDECDTVPLTLNMEQGVYKRSLKSYHSTPDCKSAGILSWDRKPRNLGKPMRVKITAMQQLQEGNGNQGKADGDAETDVFNQAMFDEVTDVKASQQDKTNGQTGAAANESKQSKQGFTHPPQPPCMEQDVPHDNTQEMLLSVRNRLKLTPKPIDCDLDGTADHTNVSEVSKDSGINTPPLDTGMSGDLAKDVFQNLPHINSDMAVTDPNESLLGAKSTAGSTATLSTMKELGCAPLNMSKTAQRIAQPVVPQKIAMPQPSGSLVAPQSYTMPHPVVSAMAPQPAQPYATPQPSKLSMATQPSAVPQPAAQPTAFCNPTPGKPMQILTVNNNNYTVLKLLGRGGSSKVYETLDCDYKLRAVKCVNLENADETTINSYKNEIKLLERLKHSNKIIKIFDYEHQQDSNILYVVMERGDTDLASLFSQETKKNQGIDNVMKKFYWNEMLKAVQVLHNEGIVHSDLKPANFVLVAGSLKLIDFGIANVIHQDMTSVIRDQQVGTLNYMSPEAIQDTCGGMQLDENGRVKPKIKIGVKSDVWSLGCILYNLVYGRTPFHHISNGFMKLQAITNPNYIIDFPEGVDPSLRQVLIKCLKRDPKERPSIQELLSYPY